MDQNRYLTAWEYILFLAERRGWIQTRDPEARQQARDRRDTEQSDRDNDERHRVSRFHMVNQCPEQFPSEPRKHEADRNASSA
jgi:hypothetical protein